MVFHRKLGIHPFELAVLGFQIAKTLHVRSFHPAVLGLPNVVRRIGNIQLATDILDLAASLDLLHVATIWLSVNLLLRIVGLLGS